MNPDLHPRPQFRRDSCHLLDGPWSFAARPAGEIDPPGSSTPPEMNREIRVPFAPETPASGLELQGYLGTCWYRRTFDRPAVGDGERVLLHFEAVDFRCDVWVNGQRVGTHEGGYGRFSFDITDALSEEETQTLLVRVDDDPHDVSQPRGKQDWLPEPHAIWYPRTTGIWQSVWLETVPAARLERADWAADLTRWELHLDASVLKPRATQMSLRVTLRHGDETLLRDTCSVAADGGVLRALRLPDPGIDDARQRLLWRPGSPTLIDATLELVDEGDTVVDRVESYAAMRSVRLERDRFLLNDRPLQLRLALDQGYWSDSGLTPPDDDALKRDIELTMQLGFNGVRKHQKIESERFLYWADKLGLLVWEELPSVYPYTTVGMERLVATWTAAIRRDRSHPCIIAWVPVNESWGFPDLPTSAQQRDGVRALYRLTKALDPTRPVIGNDGWEMVETDVIAVHEYEADPDKLRDKFDASAKPPAEILATARLGGRIPLLDASVYHGQPIMLTEFGGVAYSPDETATWGYSRAANGGDFLRRYSGLLAAARENPLFAGFCYTQLTDTYQEANGLLRMDRTPKAPIELLKIATAGPANENERKRLADAM